LKVPEAQKSVSLDNVISLNRSNQVRREIAIIADRSFRERLINDESFSEYLKLADGREDHKMTEDMLESTRKFASEHEEKAIRIHKKIMTAQRSKIASETDEDFLMKNLVTDNIQFAGQSAEVEALIDKKLARMKDDKKCYDTLSNHKLIKNVGYLKVNSSIKIDLPKEDEFLKMTVPERRELLKKMEKALPEAEEYAEENSKVVDLKQVSDYKKKLSDAVEHRIISKNTADKFMDGFNKIDSEEKEYWLSEFDAEMERYETLWENIRSSLQGSALNHMEEKLNHMGYTELLVEFGQVEKAESSSLGAEYSENLESYQKQGIIGNQTVSEFNIWMKEQDMSQKYDALDKLPEEMERYKQLWTDVDGLKSKEQAFMKSKIDDWGYTDMNHQLQAFKSGETIKEEGGISGSEKILAGVRSAEVRNAIKENDELLADQGESKSSVFTRIMDKALGRESSSRFDATRFQEKVKNKAGKLKPDVINQDGFIQVESANEKGETTRNTQVQINGEKSMERLFSEDSKHNYRSQMDGGSDDLSLAIKNKAGATVELDLQEIRILAEYRKKRAEERGEDN